MIELKNYIAVNTDTKDKYLIYVDTSVIVSTERHYILINISNKNNKKFIVQNTVFDTLYNVLKDEGFELSKR